LTAEAPCLGTPPCRPYVSGMFARSWSGATARCLSTGAAAL